MVMAIQLGIPVSMSGILNASSVIVVLFFKPLIATITDTFPSFRRTIFVLTLCVASVALGCIYFVPSMQDVPRLHGHLVSVTQLTNFSDPLFLFSGKNLFDKKTSVKNNGECPFFHISCNTRDGIRAIWHKWWNFIFLKVMKNIVWCFKVIHSFHSLLWN